MDPPLHSGVKLVVSWVDSSRWKSTKDTNISRQGFGLCILGFINYLEKGRTINNKCYKALLVCLKEEIAKKTTTNEEAKSALSLRQCTVSQVNCNDGKTTWIALWIASATGCLQKECSREIDLAPLKKWYRKLRHILRLKINRSTKKASNCKRSVGISVSASKEPMLMNKVELCLKAVVLLVRPGTYWVMCYLKL